MNVTLGERVLALSQPEGRDVLELFAGSGNFTVLLARHAASLVAVESDGRAVGAARVNLVARGLAARLVEGDADAFDIPARIRTVLLDPPRGGAPGTSTRLARSRVRRVAYVSCDVSTLARDVMTLAAGGFHLSGIETFEMFPHTSHVEVLAILERSPKQPKGPP
jgi:23S rRNA (uracil1939-C5)-methyltransferase